MTRRMPPVAGVEHRFVELSGMRMHVAEAGAGEPLVMLHGWPQHWYAWRRLIPLLAEHHRVICPDLRGFGWSDAPASGYEKEHLAGDVLELLDGLGLERVRLIGHDWGGMVGFLLCLREPQRVERFVAINTGHPWLGLDPAVLTGAWRFAYQLVISTPLFGRLAVQTGSQLLRRVFLGSPLGDEEIAVFADQFAEPERAAASVQLYRTFLAREYPAIVGGRYRRTRLETPTLFLAGDRDPVMTDYVLRGWERHADDMSLEVLEGIGHFAPEQFPERVAERALSFFGEKAARRSGRSSRAGRRGAARS